jgi:hypothetical protein
MNMKKHILLVSAPTILLMAALAAPLSAQSVFVSPVTGGSQAERSYFRSRFSDELTKTGYKLANALEDSDFYMTITVEKDEDANAVSLALYNTKTKDMTGSSMMGYEALAEMDKWNSYLVKEVMARAPGAAGRASGAKAKPSSVAPQYWLYAGARGGYSMRFYMDTGENYEFITEEWTRGNTFEAGARLSGQIVPFLAIQAEALITRDTAIYKQSKKAPEVEFKTLSLMFPLVGKITFRPGQWLIAPLGGVYMNVGIGEMTVIVEKTESKTAWKWDDKLHGLGWTAGLEVGGHVGPGTLFLDLRYSHDIGNTMTTEKKVETGVYGRDGATVSLGYDFGIFRKK